jgi:hypothetical protein
VATRRTYGAGALTLPFALSYSCLCGAQGLTVAAAAPPRLRALYRLRSRWWALIPVASIVGTIVAIRAASETANGLTYLALVAVPPLAAFALSWAMRASRRWLGLAVIPLFALAWAFRDTLVGDAAALVLIACASVTLATLLRATTPVVYLKAGLLLMAATDTVFVVSDLLQAPNATLNAAAPAGGLPQLQRASFGDAVMGFGDLFVAGLLGVILATEPAIQKRAAWLTTGLALLFGVLFFWVDELPATVPVAVAMVLVGARGRIAHRGEATRLDVGAGSAAPG